MCYDAKFGRPRSVRVVVGGGGPNMLVRWTPTQTETDSNLQSQEHFASCSISVLVGLVSWMDLLMMVILRCLKGSRSADHAEVIPFQLDSA